MEEIILAPISPELFIDRMNSIEFVLIGLICVLGLIASTLLVTLIMRWFHVR